jgi:Mce-associated membrane protein
VPQGKAARNRHRLPRQKAQPTADGAIPEADSVPTETGQDIEVDPADDVDPAVETDEADQADKPVEGAEVDEPAETPAVSGETDAPATETVEAPARKRRLPWRRGRAAAEVTPEAPAADAEAEASRADSPVANVEAAQVESAAPEPVLVPHRPAGRALKFVAVAAGVLFVAAGAFAGATIEPYLADRAAVQTKFSIAETAANAITTLWTYTPDDMNKLPDRSARYLGGDFAAEYRRYIDAIAAPNKQAQVSNNTQVLGAAVESLTPTEATAIVYTNSVATSPVTKGIPSLRYLSYRLTMKRDDNRWLITQMVAVTKLDLTPQL